MHPTAHNVESRLTAHNVESRLTAHNVESRFAFLSAFESGFRCRPGDALRP
jgi:hypothetical protein